MDAAATLEYLRSEGSEAEFENIPVGGLLVHIEEPFQIQLHIQQRCGSVGKALRDEVEPLAHAHVQLQHADAGVQEVVEGFLSCGADAEDIFEVDVGEDIEAVHGLDGDIVWRSSELLGVQIGHNESPPEEGAVPVEGHPVFAGIGSEEAEVTKIFGTVDIDTGFGCLHRCVEVISSSLPRHLDGRHSGESHLLRSPGVTPLGNLASPEDPLEFGAHLRPIFESENCHRTFSLARKGTFAQRFPSETLSQSWKSANFVS